jgi:hypothetical protein
MKKIVLSIVVAVFQCFSITVNAYELTRSGKTDSWDNPFIAFGYNPATKITTGYLAALRTAPGRTDECKLVFASNSDKSDEFIVRYIARNGAFRKSGQSLHHVPLVVEENVLYLKFSKKELGGDCDWILPFVVETDVNEDNDDVLVAMEAQNAGKWIAVYAISAEKARFHGEPVSSSVKNSFLI